MITLAWILIVVCVLGAIFVGLRMAKRMRTIRSIRRDSDTEYKRYCDELAVIDAEAMEALKNDNKELARACYQRRIKRMEEHSTFLEGLEAKLENR